MTAPGGSIPGPVGRGGRKAGAVVVAALLATVWLGCSVERNYKLLSFFFDGVPDPEKVRAVEEAAAKGEGDIRQSPTYTVHRPYVEEKCADCHRGRLRISKNDSSICVECHQNMTDQHPVMHGPVAAGACMWCHAPHESAFPSLMKARPRDVCMQCHTDEMLVNPRAPEHGQASRDCLECHYGHGSPDRFMLKSPTTEPSNTRPPAEPGAGPD